MYFSDLIFEVLFHSFIPRILLSISHMPVLGATFITWNCLDSAPNWPVCVPEHLAQRLGALRNACGKGLVFTPCLLSVALFSVVTVTIVNSVTEHNTDTSLSVPKSRWSSLGRS